MVVWPSAVAAPAVGWGAPVLTAGAGSLVISPVPWFTSKPWGGAGSSGAGVPGRAWGVVSITSPLVRLQFVRKEGDFMKQFLS